MEVDPELWYVEASRGKGGGGLGLSLEEVSRKDGKRYIIVVILPVTISISFSLPLDLFFSSPLSSDMIPDGYQLVSPRCRSVPTRYHLIPDRYHPIPMWSINGVLVGTYGVIDMIPIAIRNLISSQGVPVV